LTTASSEPISAFIRTNAIGILVFASTVNAFVLCIKSFELSGRALLLTSTGRH